MGYLRFILAALVVYGHCYYPFGRLGLSGENAVQIFYMISGFYMTMVLRGKYGASGSVDVRAFYLNRALRLYPAYAIVVMATGALCLGAPLMGWEMDQTRLFSDWYGSGLLDLPAVVALFVSQVTMLGLDGFNLVDLSPDGGWLLNTGAGNYPLWKLLMVPQAWSLSIEIYFYLLAPFVVARGWPTVLGFAVASYAVRLLLWAGPGLFHDPWSYRFFPSELLFFLAGSLAFRSYANDADFRSLGRLGKAALQVALAGMLFTAVWLGKIDQPLRLGIVLPPLATAAVFLALPGLFRLTRRDTRDRLFGELSYPMYLSHAIAVWMVGRGDYQVGGTGFLIVFTLTLLFSYALYRFVDLPVDAYRQRRVPARGGLSAQATW